MQVAKDEELEHQINKKSGSRYINRHTVRYIYFPLKMMRVSMEYLKRGYQISNKYIISKYMGRSRKFSQGGCPDNLFSS